MGQSYSHWWTNFAHANRREMGLIQLEYHELGAIMLDKFIKLSMDYTSMLRS